MGVTDGRKNNSSFICRCNVGKCISNDRVGIHDIIGNGFRKEYENGKEERT